MGWEVRRVDLESTAPEARNALDTAQQAGIAVNFDQLARARLAVEVVDILGEQAGEEAGVFQRGQGLVPRVGLGLGQRLAQTP